MSLRCSGASNDWRSLNHNTPLRVCRKKVFDKYGLGLKGNSRCRRNTTTIHQRDTPPWWVKRYRKKTAESFITRSIKQKNGWRLSRRLSRKRGKMVIRTIHQLKKLSRSAKRLRRKENFKGKRFITWYCQIGPWFRVKGNAELEKHGYKNNLSSANSVRLKRQRRKRHIKRRVSPIDSSTA